MHIVVRTNYPANARSTTIASHECGGAGGDGIRVREIELQPNRSLRGTVQVSPRMSVGTGIVGLQVTNQNMRHQHDCNDYASSKLVGEMFAPAICELSIPQRWYIPTLASENIQIVTFSAATVTRAQS